MSLLVYSNFEVFFLVYYYFLPGSIRVQSLVGAGGLFVVSSSKIQFFMDKNNKKKWNKVVLILYWEQCRRLWCKCTSCYPLHRAKHVRKAVKIECTWRGPIMSWLSNKQRAFFIKCSGLVLAQGPIGGQRIRQLDEGNYPPLSLLPFHFPSEQKIWGPIESLRPFWMIPQC